MEPLKHECGVALVRLRKPLEYYVEKYGSWTYGLDKLYLMMEKEHNRGQEGAGLACVKMKAQPGEEMIYRERELGAQGIEKIFAAVKDRIAKYSPKQQSDLDFVKHHLPYAGEIYMGHLRYATTGKRGLNYIHPFLRRSNWRAKNLCICANFNMTNVEEIFDNIAQTGQHPRMMSDTYIMLEQLGHRLDRESERLFQQAMQEGLSGLEVTEYIEKHIDLSHMLSETAHLWDGGYAVLGVTGSGESFAIRDPWGIRPCFWYMDDEIFAVASERPVLQTSFGLEKDEVNELEPGMALLMNQVGELRKQQILEPKPLAACSFERVYFSRGSDADIYQERKQLGHSLVEDVLKAVDYDIENTVFSFIPNTAEIAYYGMIEGLEQYNNELKLRELDALYKTREATPEKVSAILNRRVRSEKVAWKDIKMRTFIAEGDNRRSLAGHVYDVTYDVVRPYKDNLVVIDDSIVRGTTLRESILRILDQLHPKRIVVVSSSPQVRYPDFYGIDMSGLDEFIAFRAAVSLLQKQGNHALLYQTYLQCKEQLHLPKEMQTEVVRNIYKPFTADEISQEICRLLRSDDLKADVRLVFQSLEGLHKACPQSPGDWYFSGHYPTPGGIKRVNEAYIHFYEKEMQDQLLPLT
ncbi:MAG: amidophosphoribosyltransferase [Alloprevotella sp.]|nr:amidophosphoribosyltransferase [Alloprevotella sp.]